ncbi:hypothetical protein PMAYCL1PPCAC_17035, partial [Pristionchus mayeri]
VPLREEMERPVLFYFLLPFSLITLPLYARILVIASNSPLSFNSFFYKQSRSQAFLDLTFLIQCFVTQTLAEFSNFWHLLTDLNGTIIPQLIYCISYLCMLGQAYGITLIAINRMLHVCYPSSLFTTVVSSNIFSFVM